MAAESRFITADRIHDGRRFLPQGSVLELAADRSIVAIHEEDYRDIAEHFRGVLCPGFVNAHCHLELSHMLGVIPQGTGLIPFLQAVTRQRAGFSDEQKAAARLEAFRQMGDKGVVAIGDIANTTDTQDLRSSGSIRIHTFVECIGFTEIGAAARLANSAELLDNFRSANVAGMAESIAPHAPYSVSAGLFRLISGQEPGSIISIHNQECRAEAEYYQSKTGAVRDLLEGFGIDDSFFVPSGKSSLQSYLPLISEDHPLILVHNTYSSKEDIQFAQRRPAAVYWCLCPGANLYIEGRLPDVIMLVATTANICIGTDSLASNSQLDIFAELQLLKAAFPMLSWEELLCWATANGAAALGMQHHVGSFRIGSSPGVVHISSLETDGKARRLI